MAEHNNNLVEFQEANQLVASAYKTAESLILTHRDKLDQVIRSFRLIPNLKPLSHMVCNLCFVFSSAICCLNRK